MKELKGFEKVFLNPGESCTVEVELDERAFSYYCVGAHKWCVEPGSYTISVGSSSRDIRLRGEVWFNHEAYDIWQYTRDELPTYYFGDPSSVSDSEFEKLLCGPIPENSRRNGEKLTLNSTLEDARDCKWGGRIMKLVDLITRSMSAVGSDANGMIIATIGEMPFKAMACMSGGALTLEMAEAIVGLLNEENVAENLKILGLSGVDAVNSKIGGFAGIKSGFGGMIAHFRETAKQAKKDFSEIRERMDK